MLELRGVDVCNGGCDGAGFVDFVRPTAAELGEAGRRASPSDTELDRRVLATLAQRPAPLSASSASSALSVSGRGSAPAPQRTSPRQTADDVHTRVVRLEAAVQREVVARAKTVRSSQLDLRRAFQFFDRRRIREVSFGERRRAVEFLPWHRTVCGTALSVAPHCL